MSETVPTLTTPRKSMLLRAWIGMLLPPGAWIVFLQTMWLTSEYGCATSAFIWNHIVSAGAVIISILGGIAAAVEYRSWNSAANDDGPEAPSWRYFMSVIGIFSAALFTALIIAQWLPTVMGVPCSR